MGKILTFIKKLFYTQPIIDLVADIRNNPSRYKINNYGSPVLVYRDGKCILLAFTSGDIKLLNVTYTGYKARMVHRALCYAALNGCLME